MAGFSAWKATSTAFLALLVGFLYTRSGTLSTFYYNRPGSLKMIDNLPDHQTRFVDVVRNCEDAYLNEAGGWALLSCNPGRDTWNTVMGVFVEPKVPAETGIYIYRYAEDPTSPPVKLELLDFHVPPERFHPLGIEYHEASQTLFIANPAQPGIEVFRVFASGNTAKHIRTIRHSKLRTPNSIQALDESIILVTNDHCFQAELSPVLAKLETYLGLPISTIARVTFDPYAPDGEVTVDVVATQAFPNGIALLNSTTLGVASSSGAEVLLYSSPTGFVSSISDVTIAQRIPLSFLPDNLSVDASGKLLIGGHPHAPSLEAVCKSAARCDLPEVDDSDCPKAPSWLAEWTQEGGVRNLYVGYEYGTAVTALRDVSRGFGMAVGLYAKGVMTWHA